jgi:hypothetical protein
MTIGDKLVYLAQKLKELKTFIEQEVSKLKEEISNVQTIVGPAGKDGRDGKDGLNGRDGSDGRDGVDGKDGQDGKDGLSVVDAKVDFDGSLVMTLSDGTVIDAGTIISMNNKGDFTVYKSGAVQISKYTDTALTISGYVEVTDVDGTVRKLAVVE